MTPHAFPFEDRILLTDTGSPVESVAVPGAEIQSAKVPFGRGERLCRQNALPDRDSGQDLVPESQDQMEETEQLSAGSHDEQRDL